MGLSVASGSFSNWDLGHSHDGSEMHWLSLNFPFMAGKNSPKMKPWLGIQGPSSSSPRASSAFACLLSYPIPLVLATGHWPLTVPKHTGHLQAPTSVLLHPLLIYLSSIYSLWQTPIHPLRSNSNGPFSLWVSLLTQGVSLVLSQLLPDCWKASDFFPFSPSSKSSLKAGTVSHVFIHPAYIY